MRIRFFLFSSSLLLLAGLATTLHFRPFEPFASNAQAPIRGSYHIHTEASHDGSTKASELRSSAQNLGLQFLVVTDHNTNANIVGDSDLIILNYPELSTPFGHVVGFGLSNGLSSVQRKEPWVLQEIQSRGGKAIVAHPTRRRNPWQGSWEHVGGVEIHNIADQVQDHPLRALKFLITLPFHSEFALAQLFKRNDKALSRWDDFSDPQVIGICANDSHGRFNLNSELALWSIELNAPWPEDAKGRKFSAIHSIATGSFHCTSSIIEHGGGFAFVAKLKNQELRPTGQSVAKDEVEALTIEAPHLDTDSLSMVLYRNGKSIAQSNKKTFQYLNPSPGTYRVEIHVTIPQLLRGKESVPVIYSNKIRITD